MIPALLTRISTGPRRSSTAVNMAATASSSATSPCTATASPPAAAIAGDHRLGGSAAGVVVDRHTVARGGEVLGDRPSDARRDPPVTSATRPTQIPFP